MWSDLTLDPCDPGFKVKQGSPNLKVLITHLLLFLGFRDVKPTSRNSWAGSLLCGQIDLGSPIQGEMSIAKLKSAYNSPIIGP